MEHVTITKLFITDKNRDGKPFKDKNGKPFWKISIKTDKTGNDWYSSLAFKQDDELLQLKEGDEKLLTFTEEEGYKNFKLPSKYDVLDAKLDELNHRVLKLERSRTSDGTEVPDFNSKPDFPDDIPF